jgi:membrane protease YdiL (CAAX protease family)
MDSTPDVKTILLSITALLAAEAAASFLPAKYSLNPILLLGLLRLTETALLIAVVAHGQSDLSSIGLNPAKLKIGLQKGLTWSAVFGFAAGIGFTVLWMAGLDPLGLIRSPLPHQPLNRAFFFVVGGFVGPVAEEVFFRGIVYGFLTRWGNWLAVALSSLIFVLFHPFNSFPLPQAIGGVVFALAYGKSQSLLTPITIHILGNLALFSLSLLS